VWGQLHLAGEWKSRQQRREEARQVAKLLLRRGPPKGFRWDYTLGFLGIAIGIFLVLVPPQTRVATVIWLGALFSVLVYPALHLAELVLRSNQKWRTYPTTLFILAAVVATIGLRIWPLVHRHILSQDERMSFEAPLKSQAKNREEIWIFCPQSDEIICSYAVQYVNLFREAGWKVQGNAVQRATLANPPSGVVFFKHGNGQLDPNNWRSGLWTRMSSSLVSVRQAFINIGIEPDEQSDAQLPEDVLRVYFGVEKSNEMERTSLTDSIDQMNQAIKAKQIPAPR
jgi:hypothetical protein